LSITRPVHEVPVSFAWVPDALLAVRVPWTVITALPATFTVAPGAIVTVTPDAIVTLDAID
jgi:hypothetical protein